ncbi:MAG: ATP-binding protein [Verrucomicrobiales bacterium]|nr:ATP-binding protein [Verrucomicrobiales bacterium]
MSQLSLQEILPTDLQTFLIVLLVCIWVWLGYRLAILKRGISSLTEALKTTPLPSPKDLPIVGKQNRLGKLSRIVLDTVSEADLQRDMATGTQRIQNVLLDAVKDALFIVDDFQEIRFANKAAKNLFDTKDFEGRTLIEVCLDHQFAETVDLAMNTGAAIQDQIRMANDSRVFLIESGPIDNSYQIGKGAWLMIRDISAELHTEQVRQDFVANASHELRTPLSIIKGYLEMMDGDPEHANAVRIMMKHTERLARIVDDMLLISRIESPDGRLLQNQAVFDIGDCIYDMIEQLQPMIDAQQAKIELKLPKEPENREFYGDRFYWDQIFFNLVENALKQNPAPGLKVKVQVRNEEGRFHIRIVDNGVGIPSSDLTEIFKRFYRVDKSHAQTIKGTGLGLSIVKRAVEAHHGTISVASQPGAETCFSISLPGPPAKVLEKSS